MNLRETTPRIGVLRTKDKGGSSVMEGPPWTRADSCGERKEGMRKIETKKRTKHRMKGEGKKE